MTANPEVAPVTYRPGEAHPFQAGGSEFLYVVPSGAIFRLEGLPKAALDLVREREHTREELIGAMLQQGFSGGESGNGAGELEQAEVIASIVRSRPSRNARAGFPAAADRPERHQSVQPGVRLLLRVQRRQDHEPKASRST